VSGLARHSHKEQDREGEGRKGSHGASFLDEGALARPARSPSGCLTPAPKLAAAWPELEHQLRRVLHARHVPVDDHDDLLQEVAARILASGVAFESADDLLPWASTVIRRLHIDHVRKANRVALDGHVPEVRGSADVERTVAARMELSSVAEVLVGWPIEARDTLLGARGVRQPSSVYVRRYRLRAKLISALEGWAAFVGFLRRHRPVLTPQMPTAMLALSCMVTGATAFLTSSAQASNTPVVRLAPVPVSASSPWRPVVEAAGSSGAAGPPRQPPAAKLTRGPGPSSTPKAVVRTEVPVAMRPYVQVDKSDVDEPLACVWSVTAVGRVCVDDPALPGG
jgi:hypothetical protein